MKTRSEETLPLNQLLVVLEKSQDYEREERKRRGYALLPLDLENAAKRPTNFSPRASTSGESDN
jgi:hypothetical protein